MNLPSVLHDTFVNTKVHLYRVRLYKEVQRGDGELYPDQLPEFREEAETFELQPHRESLLSTWNTS